MGRLPIGELPTYVRGSLWSRKANIRRALMLRSRRRPLGLYSLLEVDPAASLKTIRKQYRELALKYHPDKAGSSQSRSEATKKMSLLNAAMDILSNEDERKKYDLEVLGKISAESTSRVRAHRARLTRQEKGIAIAVNSERVRLKKLDSVPLAKKRKSSVSVKQVRRFVCSRGVSRRSRTIPPNCSWSIYSRTKKERTTDRRKGRYVAVPRIVSEP